MFPRRSGWYYARSPNLSSIWQVYSKVAWKLCALWSPLEVLNALLGPKTCYKGSSSNSPTKCSPHRGQLLRSFYNIHTTSSLPWRLSAIFTYASLLHLCYLADLELQMTWQSQIIPTFAPFLTMFKCYTNALFCLCPSFAHPPAHPVMCITCRTCVCCLSLLPPPLPVLIVGTRDIWGALCQTRDHHDAVLWVSHMLLCALHLWSSLLITLWHNICSVHAWECKLVVP